MQTKKGKKKRRKVQKDLTADRSIQSLYAELVSMKVIVSCPPTNIADFVAIYTSEKKNKVSFRIFLNRIVLYFLLPLTLLQGQYLPFVLSSPPSSSPSRVCLLGIFIIDDAFWRATSNYEFVYPALGELA